MGKIPLLLTPHVRGGLRCRTWSNSCTLRDSGPAPPLNLWSGIGGSGGEGRPLFRAATAPISIISLIRTICFGRSLYSPSKSNSILTCFPALSFLLAWREKEQTEGEHNSWLLANQTKVCLFCFNRSLLDQCFDS